MTEDPTQNQQSISQQPSSFSLSSVENKECLKQFWKYLFQYFETGTYDLKPTQELTKNKDSGLFSLKSNVLSKKKSGNLNEIQTIDTAKLTELFWFELQFDFPDVLVSKFLRARKYNVEQSLEMFINTLVWLDKKEHFKIKRFGENHIKTDYLKSEELYFLGNDLDNRPVCYAHARLHDPGCLTIEEQEDFAIWLMETARLLLTRGEMVTIVFDLTDMKYSNMDMGAVKVLINCLGSYFPESLGKILVLNAPWFFSGIWKIIKSLLDPVVVNKTSFVDLKQLKEHIDPAQISNKIDPAGSNYEQKYLEPSEQENSILINNAVKEELEKEFLKICKQFEDKTKEWINAKSDSDNEKLENDRLEIAKTMSSTYDKLDPYLRSKTVYHRLGVIKGDKKVDWSVLLKK